MQFSSILWDLEDDPHGNVRHCAEHGVSPEEVEEAIQNAVDADVSRTTGLPVLFGETAAGRQLLVVYEIVADETIYPITAYDVPRRRKA